VKTKAKDDEYIEFTRAHFVILDNPCGTLYMFKIQVFKGTPVPSYLVEDVKSRIETDCLIHISKRI
jgi:hypothetical protein